MTVSKLFNMHPLIAGSIFLILCLFIGVLLRVVTLGLIKYYAKRSNRGLVNSLKHRFQGAIFLFIPLIIFHIIVGQLRFTTAEVFAIRKVLEILIIISVTITIVRFINVVEDVLYSRYDIATENNLLARKARTQIGFIRKIAIIMVALVGLSLILLSFDNVRKYGATILTSAGVAGIIIGFAAQKTIANLLAGIQIAFTQPIKIDDVVIVEKEWGRIEEIKLTYVVIKIWDLRRLIVPITYFTDMPFQNWTRTSAEILGDIFLYTDYTLPVEEVRKEVSRILEATDLWDGNTNVVQVVNMTEHTMKVRILVSARDSADAFDLRCIVREHLVSFIQENFPQCLPNFRATLVNDYERFKDKDPENVGNRV